MKQKPPKGKYFSQHQLKVLDSITRTVPRPVEYNELEPKRAFVMGMRNVII